MNMVELDACIIKQKFREIPDVALLTNLRCRSVSDTFVLCCERGGHCCVSRMSLVVNERVGVYAAINRQHGLTNGAPSAGVKGWRCLHVLAFEWD